MHNRDTNISDPDRIKNRPRAHLKLRKGTHKTKKACQVFCGHATTDLNIRFGLILRLQPSQRTIKENRQTGDAKRKKSSSNTLYRPINHPITHHHPPVGSPARAAWKEEDLTTTCLLELEAKTPADRDFAKILPEERVRFGYPLRITVKGFDIIIRTRNSYVDVYDPDSYISDPEETL